MPNADYALAAGAARLRRPRTRSALLRRAPRLESRGPLRLRHQPGPRRHGGVEPPDPERLGPQALLDVLAEHPLVDPGRIGMVGISYGGTVTLFTAALDHRVAAAVVSGYFSSWAESHKMPWNMCGSQVLFGMLGPPGARGPRRSRRAAARCWSRPAPRTCCSPWRRPPSRCAAPVWSTTAQGAPDRLVHDVFEGGHQWHGTEALPFLDHWLAHDPAPRPAEYSARRSGCVGRPGVIARTAPQSALPQHLVERRVGSPSPLSRPGRSDGSVRLVRCTGVVPACIHARQRAGAAPGPGVAPTTRSCAGPSKADARTTLPCTSLAVGTETGWAVGTFISERTADTGVPGPR